MDKSHLIELLSPELKAYLHALSQEAAANTIRDGQLSPSDPQYMPPDVLSLAKHHYRVLSTVKDNPLTGKDAEILKRYISGQPISIQQRSMTKAMTDHMVYQTELFMHAGIWITHEYSSDFNVTMHATARRKDWYGEQLKMLLQAVELSYTDSNIFVSPPRIFDLFGLRMIIDQTDDPQVLLAITKIMVAILTDPESAEHKEFCNWIMNTDKIYGGSPIPKESLLQFLEYSLIVHQEKNYVTVPKPNGYESYHIIFGTPIGSPYAGSYWEFQGRTRKMHEKSEYGGNLSEDEKAGGLAHFDYKKIIDALKKEIFGIDDYKGGILFYNPNIGYDDDGVSSSKVIATRTSSIHLVSKK